MELEHGRLLPVADVERAAVVTGCGEQGADHIADVDEVAYLQPVAEDQRLLAARHPLEEDRDDAPLERGVLPRSVDVREAQDDMVAAVDAVPAA